MLLAPVERQVAGINHVLRSQQFDRGMLATLFGKADEMRLRMETQNGREYLKSLLCGLSAVNLLYEPSTRTRFSFEFAEQYLGMHWHSTENAAKFSSAIKGESIEDTIRVFCGYRPDCVVIRHKVTGMVERAAAKSSIPIINAGDGTGQHPTQALADLKIIQHRLGQVDDLIVMICGDCKHSRVARSLAYMLSKFSGIHLIFVTPKQFRIGEDIKSHLQEDKVRRNGVTYEETEDVEGALKRANVACWLRLQRERMPWLMKLRYRFIANQYRMTAERAEMMPKSSIIIHPLPRVDEVTLEVDDNPRAAYFPQAEWAMYMRMALLLGVFGKW